MTSVIKSANWIPKECVLLKVTPNKGGQGRTVRINSTQSKRWLVVSMPKMMTWGASENIDPSSGRVSYAASLQFEERGVNPEADAFRDQLVEFDELIIDRITENSATYWGMKKSREVIEEGFSRSLRYPLHSDKQLKEQKVKDFTKNPHLSGKIGVYLDQESGGEKWDMTVFKPAKPSPVQVFPAPDTPPTYEGAQIAVPKFAQVKTIMEAKVWVGDKPTCGVTWYIKQMIVISTKSPMANNLECQFLAEDNEVEDEEEEEEEGCETEVDTKPVAVATAVASKATAKVAVAKAKAVPVYDDDVAPISMTPSAPPALPVEEEDDNASESSEESGTYSTGDERNKPEPSPAPAPAPAPVVSTAPIRRVPKAVPAPTPVVETPAPAPTPVVETPAPAPAPTVRRVSRAAKK